MAGIQTIEGPESVIDILIMAKMWLRSLVGADIHREKNTTHLCLLFCLLFCKKYEILTDLRPFKRVNTKHYRSGPYRLFRSRSGTNVYNGVGHLKQFRVLGTKGPQ